MARYKGPKVKLFLQLIYKEANGSSVRAAELAGYVDPVLSGPRLRRRYSDLVEAARLAWAETAHMGYDEALAVLAKVGRDSTHRDHVRALNMIIELQNSRASIDPITLRREVAGLIKEISQRKALTPAQAIPVEAELVSTEELDSPPQRVAS